MSDTYIYSKVLSMLILQTFHKDESEVEPRVVFVVIHENLKPVNEISNFHESQYL